MPQINQLALVAYSQFFWLLLVLALIYFGIGRMMLPKIQSTVESRDQRISGDLAAAQAAREAAEGTEADLGSANASADFGDDGPPSLPAFRAKDPPASAERLILDARVQLLEPTKRAVPSTLFSAILPAKPSHTITSWSPRASLSPSTKPVVS